MKSRRVLRGMSVFVFGIMMYLASIDARAQANQPACTAQTAREFSVRGLRLGMTVDEVLALIPDENRGAYRTQVEQSAKSNYGFAHLSFYKSNRQLNSAAWIGVGDVSVQFLDGKAARFSVSYLNQRDGGADWDSVGQWILKLRETFRTLPDLAFWDSDNNGKHLNCDGYVISANTSDLRGSIAIYDKSVEATVRARVTAEAERRRSAFKP